jgi:hypothetical protein
MRTLGVGRNKSFKAEAVTVEVADKTTIIGG